MKKQYEINGNLYEIVKDDDKVFDLEEVKSFMTEYFDNFDYIFGDFAYDRLRLKGFKEHGNKVNDIKYLEKYIEDYCAYGAKYFLIKKIKKQK